MSWQVLSEKNLYEIVPFLKSALDRGLFYYNYNPIDNFTYRYNQSLFKIENDTFYYGNHSQVMGTRFFKLHFPPIHLYGDEEVEKSALRNCIEQGLSYWVEGFHSLSLGVKVKSAPQFKGSRQAIYHREYELKGKKYKNIRHENNRFLGLVGCGEIEVVLDYPLDKLGGLNQTWLRQTGRRKNVFKYVLYKGSEDLSPFLRNITILKKGTPISSALYFTVCDETWHCVSAISDFDESMSGLQRQCFLHTFRMSPKLNRVLIGGYRNKGGKLSKLSLPHSLFEMKHCTAPSLTLESWNEFKPKKNKFGV